MSSFERYYQTIREHLRLITVCVVAAVAAAIVYVQLAPRSYTAQAQLLINPASQQNTLLFSLPVLHASGDPTQDVLTASALITTPQVANSVVSSLHLKESPTDVLGKVQATPLAQSDIVAVQATSSSARQAQELANGFANQVIAVRTATLHRSIALLLPALRSSVAGLPAAQRSGVGTLGDQLNQLQQLATTNDPTISIAAPAAVPAAPSSPRKSLSLAAGLIVGLLIGVGAAFAFDALDPRLRREEQLRDRIPGVPVLARIPRIHRRRRRRRRPGPLTPMELTGAALEQYRALRASLVGRGGAKAQAFLVTGSVPSEGKSTTAIGLAAVLAQRGNSVILIEADLRRPRLAAAFRLAAFTGTEQVLENESRLPDALVPVTMGEAIVQVLAAHQRQASETDHLSPSSARQLVRAAKRVADFVVIDSPPLTAVVDALPFAQVVDGVVVAARIGHTRLNKLAELDELLAHHGTEVSGLVLVGVPPSRFGHEYYAADGFEEWRDPQPAEPEIRKPPSPIRRSKQPIRRV